MSTEVHARNSQGVDVSTAVESIAVIGGTGPQGRGLALRFAQAGHRVVLGSREATRAVSAAADLDHVGLSGADNVSACHEADIVLLAVPYAGHDQIVQDLAPHLVDKIVVTCVNPLGFDERGPFGLELESGSAAEAAAAMLPSSHVVAGFHHLAAGKLLNLSVDLTEETVMVCGDAPEAVARTAELAVAITGQRAVEVGPLRLARQLEPLTAVLISVNKRYRTHAGVALIGVPHGALAN